MHKQISRITNRAASGSILRQMVNSKLALTFRYPGTAVYVAQAEAQDLARPDLVDVAFQLPVKLLLIFNSLRDDQEMTLLKLERSLILAPK
jgi:hypothetical protein